MLQRVVTVAFVITLAVSLVGGILLIAGQTLSLVIGQGEWLSFLDATATMAAVGTVGVAALVAAGVPATTAAVAVLVFSSCEAAVPPGGAPLYVACGIADVDPFQTFGRLVLYYALPLLGIGVFIALGILPV